MSSFPLLFDLGSSKPTTRDVARTVKEGGSAALTEAERRADQARYQEVTCRSALNRVKGMPFEWTLNPYRGCTHACHYCFARRYHSQFELDSDDQFASVILVKSNLVSVLARELDHPSWQRAQVALGTATDPYQPIEGHYRLTRQCLQVLSAARNPFSIITRGPMIVRDIDVLQEASRRAEVHITFSVPTLDPTIWRRTEPGTAPPRQRLRALRALVDAGIDAGVGIAPVLPGITDKVALLAEVVKSARDAGATGVWCNVLFLAPGTREHFLEHLARDWPELLARYEQMYTATYASKSVGDPIRKMVAALREQYGVGDRRPVKLEPEPRPEQLSLAV